MGEGSGTNNAADVAVGLTVFLSYACQDAEKAGASFMDARRGSL
ncbi:MAG: hypothetical protein QOI88_4404 [Gammaproteobacteria bacterium]|jgi:hypothetical protein|nr:hypothetical protein [Gammaproteobacteria bacterium]